MFKILVIVALSAVATNADPVKCGAFPHEMYKCIGNPTVIPKDILAECINITSECERNNCVFRKSGWMDGDKIDKTKVGAFFEGLAVGNDNWPVEKIKTNCLSGDLPAQGVEVNCPAYDIMHCAVTTYMKNAKPSLWSKETECDYPRKYVDQCPICPKGCVGKTVTEGLCNACKAS